MYAGQRKVAKEIDNKIKKENYSQKSNEKRAEAKKLYYYARLLNKNL